MATKELEELDIKEVLGQLEDGYDIIASNFFKEQIDFLSMGDGVVDLNVLPDIDIPLTLNDYVKLL